MQNDIIQKLKDKLQMDLEQCAKDKVELKSQGLFSKSDVILGRETEIKELQEYIEGLEEATGVEDDCGRDYVERTGKCPICINCPHNCPLDNNNSGGVKV